ncbi:MAG: DUF6817 domain-containing protein [Cellvibrionaceae bacterium]
MHNELLKMNDKFRKLSELGAEEFDHVDGSLADHQKGTKKLLEQWGASVDLQDAGLYHAVYGTAGFAENMVSIEQRRDIADIIGTSAEEIVYQYCACAREEFFAKIGNEPEPEFKNRFTGKSYRLTSGMLKNFCELTAANEIEIAIDNAEFMAQHGADLRQLFTRMAPYLNAAALEKVENVFLDNITY